MSATWSAHLALSFAENAENECRPVRAEWTSETIGRQDEEAKQWFNVETTLIEASSGTMTWRDEKAEND